MLTPDTTTGRVYFADGDRNGTKFTAFDLATFAPLASTVVPGAQGAQNLIRWGADGLAFSTSSGKVMLVRTSIIGPKLKTADLAVSSSGLPDVLPASGTTACIVTVTNVGLTPETGIALTDIMSRNVDILNVSASSGMAIVVNGPARAARSGSES